MPTLVSTWKKGGSSIFNATGPTVWLVNFYTTDIIHSFWLFANKKKTKNNFSIESKVVSSLTFDRTEVNK